MSKTCAIIGAGISGLTAALTFSDTLKDNIIHIYEAKDVVGGRIHSVSTGVWPAPVSSEWCAEFIDHNHQIMLNLAKRFKLPLTEVSANAGRSKELSSTYFINNTQYTYQSIIKDSIPVMDTIREQTRLVSCSNHQIMKLLDNLNLYDWIDYFVSPGTGQLVKNLDLSYRLRGSRGGQSSLFGSFLDSTMNQLYGSNTKEQSSLNLIYSGFNVNNLSTVCYNITGGNDQLPKAIYKHLKSRPNFNFHFDHRLTKIVSNANQTATLTFNDHIEATFDHVIITIPFSAIRGCNQTVNFNKSLAVDCRHAGFSPIKDYIIRNSGAGTSTKASLLFDSRYWNSLHVWGSGNSTSGLTRGSNGSILTNDYGVWESSMNTNSQCSLLTVYPNANDPILSKLTESYIVITERDHQVVVNLLARLELIYKGLSAHYLGPTTISNPKVDPYAYGSYSYWKPGQYTLFAGFENVTENNIHFAGEGCSLKHQGYMEGAAEEGIRVANEIMNQKNLRTRHQLSKL